MREIKNVSLSELVDQQEDVVLKGKKDRISLLIKEKLEKRERIKENICELQKDLEDVEFTIEQLKKEDWTKINWKLDDSEKG
jgi:hypothetical protein